jgi:SWI/SNF-related matrix-associated actin-dependent regulator 1 of chromatin subfamily A
VNRLPSLSSTARSMAPAGTRYQPPAGIVRGPQQPYKPINDSDDDELTLIGGSSDTEGPSRGDIQPSTFLPSNNNRSFTANGAGGQGTDRFKKMVNSFTHDPNKPQGLAGSVFDTRNRNSDATSSKIATAAKPKTSDGMTMGYASRKPQTQARPDRAQPVQDTSLDDIQDEGLKRKVERLRGVYPWASVLLCKNAILAAKGHFDDAAEALSSQFQEISDDEKNQDVVFLEKREIPAMKRQLEKPLATITQRFGTGQARPAAGSSQPSSHVYPEMPMKPKRKLVQGRKKATSSTPEPVVSKEPSPEVEELSDRDSNDSGVASEEEVDTEVEEKVLKFFNTCKAEELVDLTSVNKDDAQSLLDQRPFASASAVREVSIATKNAKTGRKNTKAMFGEKTFDLAVAMWTGYEAVDALVYECEQLGKPLAEAMSKWGVNVFGAKEGELEMTSLEEDDKDSTKDSGIGTPSSSRSHEKDDDDIKVLAPARKAAFLRQPALMSENIVLKDYQLVGLNWLALLYKHKLSCILADEMGLGKTCQVISFLAHLAETGHSGPHLVIVPGSTLENWLREFKNFCPNLVVEPYYGEFLFC